jgi:hypothetical protein
LLLAVVMLTACDNEPAQRKAFIDFLQSRIVGKPGVHVPQLTPDETASFGDYAKQYAVITDFNAGLDRTVSPQLQHTVAGGALRSLGEVVTRRKDIATLRDGIVAIRSELDQQLAKADAAHAALKQPADLKPVFDAAYDRDVTQPAKAMIAIFPDVDEAFIATLALGEFLEQHANAIKIEGSMIQISDASLQPRLQELLDALRAKQETVHKAQQRLHDIAFGS